MNMSPTRKYPKTNISQSAHMPAWTCSQTDMCQNGRMRVWRDRRRLSRQTAVRAHCGAKLADAKVHPKTTVLESTSRLESETTRDLKSPERIFWSGSPSKNSLLLTAEPTPRGNHGAHARPRRARAPKMSGRRPEPKRTRSYLAILNPANLPTHCRFLTRWVPRRTHTGNAARARSRTSSFSSCSIEKTCLVTFVRRATSGRMRDKPLAPDARMHVPFSNHSKGVPNWQRGSEQGFPDELAAARRAKSGGRRQTH
ncbi:hypothetical protein TGME49_282160 [Toxoplasma gondii ME49]|uniref:Uncharacterized protein n=10 Tax=Toxoplasma gondii TaxID=5811 RepID=B6KU99_TOXGV|nr:hypothetical protein TGME49_282160 [Toxoplasma gondii ME49]ESS32835.1 hypothetical protein TGVEG_282160 [Toxoplasma gondii VEG]KFG28616.1 hypothetical protein TGP89_282160 [Toxoplasma gondii p89]KFG36661.1 hypothetical protein TGFOU_282160 [Toxoplasma gondii FOU]KFG41285.1 hypothetical protein TGDOM2_282160 [Toxoplasma gondii GAB2-2007-GAL-DOM2]KFG57462.1 hypothetical protein TGRUB_282160 [Toxoplasma gondii RUB]KFH00258.1 hypothetical protein TGVAND_282160 [Toxoplasma gondii VAND]KFH06268|eukprot:XP_002371422.1 hypothetical protein TGME49_282160 [Toxoplasma gondii ME49]